jgi:hypothetical protein
MPRESRSALRLVLFSRPLEACASKRPAASSRAFTDLHFWSRKDNPTQRNKLAVADENDAFRKTARDVPKLWAGIE